MSPAPGPAARIARAVVRAGVVALLPASLAAQRRPESPADVAAAVGRYAIVMRGPSSPDSLPATVVVTDSGGRLGGTYVREGSDLTRRLIAVLVQPGPQLVLQIDRGATFSTLVLRPRGDAVTGEAEFDGETFVVTGHRVR